MHSNKTLPPIPGAKHPLRAIGAALALACASAGAAVTDLSGNLGATLDSVVGAGNSGRLIADTKTYWAGTTSTSDVDLNGFKLTLDNGGGNAQTYNGALTGPGTLQVNGRTAADWDPDVRLGGSAHNSPAAVILNTGRLTLNKTAGIDAIAGAITTATGSNTKRIWLQKADQINDAATVDSTVGTGPLIISLNGFHEGFASLTIKTGDIVNTGTGGVLNVDALTVDGNPLPKGAYTAGTSSFVQGTGYIDVDNFGPPVIVTPPAVPANPAPAHNAADVNPAYAKKLTWNVSNGASSYEVYLWEASGSKPGTPTATVLSNEHTLAADLLSLAAYNWQVVAVNSVGSTPGPTWAFTTVARWELSGNLPGTLDTIVGAGNSGLLVGNTQTYWAGTTSSSNVNLNGFQLTLDNGGGNAQAYNGAITGPGTLRINGRYTADWDPDIRLGGTTANTPAAVIISQGRATLNKPAGVDALAGPVTIGSGGGTKRIWLQNNDQINDASTIDSTASSGLFELCLNGFSETLAGLTINAGHFVNTGSGGVLTVANLTVAGAPMNPGTYTALTHSSFVGGTGSVVVPGATPPADPNNSTVTAAPASVQANGSSSSTITVTLLDAASNPTAGKTVTLASNRGATDTISAPSGPSDAAGVVTFTVTSLTAGSPVFTATDTTDAVTITDTATVAFSAIPPADPGTSTVAAAPPSVVANGLSTSTITVTLKDGSGTPVAGKTVTLASSRGASDTISAPSGPSNASGVVTFTVTSLAAGAPVFTATDTSDGVTVTQTATVTFTTNPPASTSQSTVDAAPASVVADGAAAATITVTLKDGSGTPLAGKTVTLASDRGAADTISAASGPSDAAGVVTFTVTSLTAGNALFTATDVTDTVVLSDTAEVAFVEPGNLVDISNTLAPWEPANPGAGVKIDVAVPSGKIARLVGLTQTHWSSGGFSRPVILNGNTLIIDSGGGNAMTIAGQISGTGTVRINAGGIGILHVAGTTGNSYSGTTEVNNGPVRLAKSSGNALTGPIAVNGPMSNNFPGTGTLLWGASNQIADGSNLTLSAGASINLAGYSDVVGTLAITGDASIYLGGTTSVVHFADSSAEPWTAGKQLIIREWNGSPTGGGAEAVFFGNSAAGLSPAQLGNVGFMNPAGFDAGLYHAAILPTGEVVPTGTAVVPVAPPYDLSESAAAARAAIYTSTGRADLSGAATPLANGTRIVFFGDSITWQNTYIGMLNAALASGAGTSGMNITLVNRGINGGGVLQVRDGAPDSGYPGSTPQASFASLLASDQADLAVVFIGVNDVWWRNTSAATYEQALRDLAASAAAQGVAMVFATIAAHDESPLGTGADDPEINQFSNIVRTVAADTGAALADLRAAFVAWWQNNNYEIRLDGSYVVLKQYGLLTYDGIHPTNLGNQMIADHLADGIIAALTTTDPFADWADTKGLTGAAAAFGADPDLDGLTNGVEFVLGSEPNPANPNSNLHDRVPNGRIQGGNFVFTFSRMDDAAYLNPYVEFDTDLAAPWTTAADPGNCTITVVNGSPADTVTVAIPMAGNTRIFARLAVAAP